MVKDGCKAERSSGPLNIKVGFFVASSFSADILIYREAWYSPCMLFAISRVSAK